MFDDDGGGKFLSFFIEILSAEDLGVDCLLGILFTVRFLILVFTQASSVLYLECC